MLRAACLLMIATGAAFALSTEYWPLLRRRVHRHDQSDSRRRQPVSAARTDGARAVGVTPADRTALFARYSLDRHAVRRHGRADGVVPGTAAPQLEHHASRRNATDVRAVWRARRRCARVVSRACRAAVEAPTATPVALGPSKGIVYRLTAVVRARFVRLGVLRSVDAGAVALSTFRSVGVDGRGDSVLGEPLLCRIVPHRRAGRKTLRSDQHDGVHAPAGEHVPDRAAVRTEPAGRDCVAACALRCCNRWTCRRGPRT